MFIALVATLLYACRPEADFPVGDSINRVGQMSGTWKLASVTQVDLLAQRYNYQDPSRPDVNLVQQDITTVAPYTDITLTLNEDAAKKPTSFAVNYGNGPKIIRIPSGSWTVNDINYPQMVKMYNGADTVFFTLSNLNNLSSKMLTLQSTRYQGAKAVIQYNYIFNKN